MRADRFETTHWSVVLRAVGSVGDRSTEALSSLCGTYWYPVYAFIRRNGRSPEDASDLTQSFFADVIEKGSLSSVDPNLGRFRTFLLGAVRHFLANDQRRLGALKRGGGVANLSIDVDAAERTFAIEPVHELTPETLFERQWTLQLLDRATRRLEQEYALAGKHDVFGRLRPFLTAEGLDESYTDLAAGWGTTPGAVRVAVHRLRRQFRDALVAEISATVATPAEVEDEIEYLLKTVS
jgi:RNA polymerase sigma factor (sigma-70 family)